jgi:hypothetical protein
MIKMDKRASITRMLKADFSNAYHDAFPAEVFNTQPRFDDDHNYIGYYLQIYHGDVGENYCNEYRELYLKDGQKFKRTITYEIIEDDQT